jgi:hypothetical protein
MSSNRYQQSGFVLVTSLIMLIMITGVTLALLNRGTLQERMAGNLLNRQQSFELNESALAIIQEQRDVAAEVQLGTQYYSLGVSRTGGHYSLTNTSLGDGTAAGFADPENDSLLAQAVCINASIDPDEYNVGGPVSIILYETQVRATLAAGAKADHVFGLERFIPGSSNECPD